MHPKIRQAHEVLWRKFYCPDNDLFYEYEDWAEGGLPTPGEIAACQPNPAGWYTGMEDCCYNGSWALDGLLHAYRVTGEAPWAAKARRVWQGLARLGSMSSTPGFIVRGVAPGQMAHYPNSSADQYTAFVHAMWLYAASPVASAAERGRCAQMVEQVCRLVEAFQGNIPTEDGRPSVFGDTASMTPDRTCRLLQFYKAGHVLTGDAHWALKYSEAVEEGGRRRLQGYYGYRGERPAHAVYAVHQSSIAWRMLYECEEDPTLKAIYAEALDAAARVTAEHVADWHAWAVGAHGHLVGWREPFREFKAAHPEIDDRDPAGYRAFLDFFRYAPFSAARENDSRHLRQALEALSIAVLAVDERLKQAVRDEGWALLTGVDYPIVRFADALMGLEGVYWRGVEVGLFV